jgi:DNA mismatch endonuclease (patch repair protein)
MSQNLVPTRRRVLKKLKTSRERSLLMARVRRTGTTPEMSLRRALWALGLRYRVHSKLPGSPDIAFSQAKVAVFVDGCFWHRCPVHGSMPKTNREFWKAKLTRNRARDRNVCRKLSELSWLALRVWEHELQDISKVVGRVTRVLNKRSG